MSTHTDNSINASFAKKVKETATEILQRFKEWDQPDNVRLLVYLREGYYDKVMQELTNHVAAFVREDDDANLAENFFLIWEAGYDHEQLMERLEKLYLNYKWPEMILEVSYNWEALVVTKQTVEGLEWPTDGVSAD